MGTKKRGLSRGILAQQSGVKSETIRYYEKIGLMPEPVRSSGGHRIYNRTRRHSHLNGMSSEAFERTSVHAL